MALAARALVILAFVPVAAAAWWISPGTATSAALSPVSASSAAAITGAPILEIHEDSLTTMLLGGATSVQDVLPQVGQRGTRIEGTWRAGPMLPFAIHANPMGGEWGGASEGLVDLFTGAPEVGGMDLGFPSRGVAWGVGRTFNSAQKTSGGSSRDSDGPQGKNWFQASQPEIALYEHPSDDAGDVLYLVYGADRFVEFRRELDGEEDPSATTFRGTNGAAGIVLFAAGATDEPDTFTLTDWRGTEWTFFGFDADAGAATGQLWKVEDTAGNVTFVGDATTGSTAISSGFDGGSSEFVYDAEDRRWSYTYASLDSVKRLVSVVVETKTSGTWASPSGVVEIGRVEYDYYTTSETHGSVGDLKLVTRTVPTNEASVSVVEKTYYRYWKGSYDASANPGYPHHVRLVVGPEGTRGHDWQDVTFDEDFLTETDLNLEPFADAKFTYDLARKVREGTYSGDCGCAGGGSGEYYYSYGTNGSFSGTSGYDSTWHSRAAIERPDGAWVTQYFDETGQPLAKVLTDDDPTGSPDVWVTQVVRDSNGMVTSVHTPANSTGYTHSTGAITSSTSVGLVHAYTRETTGRTKSYVTERRWKAGTSGTAYMDTAMAYAAQTLAVGDGEVVRVTVSSSKQFPAETTSAGAGTALETTISSTYHTGTLAIETVTTTNPIVSTANNGSNSATSSKVHYDLAGRMDFRLAADGIVSYTKWEGGLATVRIEDADTAHGDFTGVSIPTGFASTGTELHRKYTTSYDAQGRSTESASPRSTLSGASNTRRAVMHRTRLADQRMVTLSFPDYDSGTGTRYGPVGYSVRNHAGGTETSGTIALTSSTSALTAYIDETDADPITAVDVGTLARLSTSLYDDAGHHVLESRAYFDIPSSGAGTDGTHYDPTSYTYDSMGRQIRTLEAHGTISRSEFDAIGRQVSSWVGTNDNGEVGGSSSGTNNMTRVSEVIYDGGAAGGNSWVTTSKAYRDGSTSDDTVTSYDVRGRALLVTGPTAPHSLTVYDNMGRPTATGLYSSTASIVVGTDEPVTEATNRLALSRTDYDERGQVYKTSRHQIDGADGSNDDSVESLTWYDEVGRTIKTKGNEWSKTAYDRLGRVERRFVLASDNDTTYADAKTVSGDVVVEEHQTVRDVDDVVLSGTIRRHPSDVGGSQTLAALDTNVDGDLRVSTIGDLKGRAQYVVNFTDRFGRQIGNTRNGNNGGSTYSRTGESSLPGSTNDRPVTAQYFNSRGELETLTDPLGRVTFYEYDDLGRLVREVKNYSVAVASGAPSGTEDNQTVRYEYTDGLQTKIIADVPSPGTDQETVYTYGTVKGASAGQSDIATGNLLQKVAYPDTSSGTDVVLYAYDAQGRETWRQDQAGNVFEMEFDAAGRPTVKRVVTLGSGMDGAVRRIGTSYDGLGRVTNVTQYDAASSGTVVDEVGFSFDGWSNVTDFDQDHNSAVNGDAYTLAHAYAKATGGRQTVRRSGTTLPNGDALTYVYSNASGALDDALSRVSGISHGATSVVRYAYDGAGFVSRTTLPTIGMVNGTTTATLGSWVGLDRHNRPNIWKWYWGINSNITAYDEELAWDRANNVIWRKDHVHAGFDVAYDIDKLNRVTRAEEGTVTAGAITSTSRDQSWTLDHLGNWDRNLLDLDGDGVFTGTDELDEARTHNTVNELLARDIDNDATDDFTKTYDALGNLTDDGQNYTYTWDAFGRLREIRNRSTTNLVQELRYNGLGFLIAEHYDANEDGDVDGSDPWYHHVWDERWRLVATFRAGDSDPKEQYVLHNAGFDGYGTSSYINDVVLRDRDANTAWDAASDGTLEERLFYLTNWRHDVVALLDSSRRQVEHTRYSAYGTPFAMPAGDTDSDGDCDATDVAQIDAWIAGSIYDLRGDLNLDGVVNATDKSIATGTYQGTTLGRGAVSSHGNRLRWAGMQDLLGADTITHVRHRAYSAELGRWLSRDPLEYVDGLGLQTIVNGRVSVVLDPMGLQGQPGTQSGGMAVADTLKCPSQTDISLGVIVPCFTAGKHKGQMGIYMQMSGIVPSLFDPKRRLAQKTEYTCTQDQVDVGYIVLYFTIQAKCACKKPSQPYMGECNLTLNGHDDPGNDGALVWGYWQTHGKKSDTFGPGGPTPGSAQLGTVVVVGATGVAAVPALGAAGAALGTVAVGATITKQGPGLARFLGKFGFSGPDATEVKCKKCGQDDDPPTATTGHGGVTQPTPGGG